MANYAHAIHTVSPSSWLHTSGVVPIDQDGTTPTDIAEQAELVWSNISTMLDEAGMTWTDLVSVTTYVVVGTELAPVMAARDRALQGHRAASALIPVPALARPEWHVEISIVAASETG